MKAVNIILIVLHVDAILSESWVFISKSPLDGFPSVSLSTFKLREHSEPPDSQNSTVVRFKDVESTIHCAKLAVSKINILGFDYLDEKRICTINIPSKTGTQAPLTEKKTQDSTTKSSSNSNDEPLTKKTTEDSTTKSSSNSNDEPLTEKTTEDSTSRSSSSSNIASTDVTQLHIELVDEQTTRTPKDISGNFSTNSSVIQLLETDCYLRENINSEGTNRTLWWKFGDKCFQIVEEENIWPVVTRECKKYHGGLAILDTKAAVDKMSSCVGKFKPLHSTRFWLGAYNGGEPGMCWLNNKYLIHTETNGMSHSQLTTVKKALLSSGYNNGWVWMAANPRLRHIFICEIELQSNSSTELSPCFNTN